MAREINLRAKRFINAYCGEAEGNAMLAAKLAGYGGDNATLKVRGCKLLRNPQVRAAIDRRLERDAATASEILDKLSRIARGSYDLVARCFKTEESGGIKRRVLDWDLVEKTGAGVLIAKVTPTKHGDSVEVYPSNRALEVLARIHGMFVDRLEVRHELTTEVIDSLSDEELELIRTGRDTPALSAKIDRLSGRPALPGPTEEVIDVEAEEIPTETAG